MAPVRADVSGQERSAPVTWRVAAGWHTALVDPRTLVQGAEARGTVGGARLAGGVQLVVDAPTELTVADPEATVKLSVRVAGGAFVSYVLPLGEQARWNLRLRVFGAGAVGFHQRDRARRSWRSHARRTHGLVSALVGLEACIAYRARGAGFSWGLALRVGADVVLTPPLIGNEVAGVFVSEHALWSVEPKGVVQLELGSP